MWDHNGSAHNISYRKYFIDLFGTAILLMAFLQMVLDTIVATQYHACHQSQHFLCFYAQCPLCVCLCIKVKEPFDHQVVLCKDHLVHPGAVVVEFFYL